jgi:exportin-1
MATRTPRIKGLRTVKKEILKLVQTYIEEAEDLQVVMENLVPPLLEAILLDYQRNTEQARDAEVLNVMAGVINRMGVSLHSILPKLVSNRIY